MVLVGIVAWSTHRHHSKYLEKERIKKDLQINIDAGIGEKASHDIHTLLVPTAKLVEQVSMDLYHRKKKNLAKDQEEAELLREQTKVLKMKVHDLFHRLPEDALDK